MLEEVRSTRPAMNRRKVGNDYEKLAANYLEARGYEILEYNFYTRTGEIDLIAKHGIYLVFVEVKYRKDASAGHPFEAISIQKQRSISRSALYYMKKKGLPEMPIRFDVVGILGEQIELIQNAFEFVM